jgi:hypothetical protein
MVFEQATVIDSILLIGSCVRGKAYLKSSMLTDTAQVQGSARILNCSLSGRSVISIGEYQDDSFHEVSDLLYEVYDSKLDYIQEVTVKYNNVSYKGWAEIVPGKNRAILFKTKDLQHPVKTISGMDITVTPQDLYGRDKF